MKTLFLGLMLVAMLGGTALAKPHDKKNDNYDTAQVAEPSSFILLGSGLAGFVIWFRKKPPK